MSGRPTWFQSLLHIDRALTLRCLATPGKHPRLYRVCALLAHSGDGAVLALIGVALWLAVPALRETAMLAAAAVMLSALLVAVLKFNLRRERPLGPESARWSAAPQHDIYSFPSGHAARVASLTLITTTLWPRGALWLVPWALLVGLARVAVGAHYWLDIAAGWLLGLGAAWLVHWAWQTLGMAG